MLPLITSMDLTDYDADEAMQAAQLVSGVVRGWCGWHIAPVVTEEVLAEGRGGRVLSLPTLRLVEAPTFVIDGTPYVGATTWAQRGTVRLADGLRWGTGYGSTVVTITHGWEETPDAVRAVCIAMARRALSNPEQLRQESVAGYSATFSVESMSSVYGITNAERSILGRYRLIPSP